MGKLELLTQLSDELLVPSAVVNEILAGPEGDPARKAIADGWGKRLAEEQVETKIADFGLGDGETAVLSAALGRPRAVAVLDDARARSAARALGIPMIGTVAVIARAKLRGQVDSVSKVIFDLRAAGLHLMTP